MKRNKTGRLDLKTLRTIIDGMILTRSAAYDPSPSKGVLPTGALIYWRTPEEWATLIYTWVRSRSSCPTSRPLPVTLYILTVALR